MNRGGGVGRKWGGGEGAGLKAVDGECVIKGAWLEAEVEHGGVVKGGSGVSGLKGAALVADVG